MSSYFALLSKRDQHTILPSFALCPLFPPVTPVGLEKSPLQRNVLWTASGNVLALQGEEGKVGQKYVTAVCKLRRQRHGKRAGTARGWPRLRCSWPRQPKLPNMQLTAGSKRQQLKHNRR